MKTDESVVAHVQTTVVETVVGSHGLRANRSTHSISCMGARVVCRPMRTTQRAAPSKTLQQLTLRVVVKDFELRDSLLRTSSPEFAKTTAQLAKEGWSQSDMAAALRSLSKESASPHDDVLGGSE